MAHQRPSGSWKIDPSFAPRFFLGMIVPPRLLQPTLDAIERCADRICYFCSSLSGLLHQPDVLLFLVKTALGAPLRSGASAPLTIHPPLPRCFEQRSAAVAQRQSVLLNYGERDLQENIAADRP